MPWSAFVADLRELVAESESPEKLNLPALAAAPFEGGYRSNDTVGAHTALLVDIDDAGPDPARFIRRVTEACRCVVYESPSSTDEAPRFRVAVALPEPYPAHAAPLARARWAKGVASLDPDACGAAKAAAPAQIFFAGRLEGTRERTVWVSDSTAPVWTPPKPGAAPPPSARRSRDEEPEEISPTRAPDAVPTIPAEVITAIEPEKRGGMRRGGRAAMRALGGLLAREGWHPAAIAEAVAEQIPSDQPETRAEQARDAAEAYYSGIERTAGAQALEAELGAEAVEAIRAQCGDPWLIDRGEAWVAAEPRRKRKVKARASAERAAKREPAPVEEAAPESGEEFATEDPSGLQLCGGTGWPWVVQYGTQFWLHDLAKRAYLGRTYATSELEAAVANHLAGVIPEEDRTKGELQRRWVGVANVVRCAYTARECTYDCEARTITVPTLRWAPFKAKRHAEIDRWLRALAVTEMGYERLAQWLAAVVELDRPAPCLYIVGSKGLGKSLIADALAALWGKASQPCKMKTATHQYNGALAECPLIFTDEGFPPDFDFMQFREDVTSRSVDVNRKFGLQGAVEGCRRYILCANNDSALKYQRVGVLTPADIEAIADRILVIRCGSKKDEARTRAVLSDLDTNWIVTQGLAEHALWLHETVELQPPSERMAARPGGAEVLLKRVVGGRHSDIVLKISEALAAGELGAAMGVWVPKDVEGQLWVKVTRLWQGLVEDGSRASLNDVKDLCDALAAKSGAHVRKIDKASHKVRILSREAFDEMLAGLD